MKKFQKVLKINTKTLHKNDEKIKSLEKELEISMADLKQYKKNDKKASSDKKKSSNNKDDDKYDEEDEYNDDEHNAAENVNKNELQNYLQTLVDEEQEIWDEKEEKAWRKYINRIINK